MAGVLGSEMKPSDSFVPILKRLLTRADPDMASTKWQRYRTTHVAGLSPTTVKVLP